VHILDLSGVRLLRRFELADFRHVRVREAGRADRDVREDRELVRLRDRRAEQRRYGGELVLGDVDDAVLPVLRAGFAAVPLRREQPSMSLGRGRGERVPEHAVRECSCGLW
jgi:hypothetical protein